MLARFLLRHPLFICFSSEWKAVPLGQMQSFSASLTDSLYELVRLRYGEHWCRRPRLTNRMLTRTQSHPRETVVVRRGGGEIEFFVLLHVAMELPTNYPHSR